jgi:hypothetical protein
MKRLQSLSVAAVLAVAAMILAPGSAGAQTWRTPLVAATDNAATADFRKVQRARRNRGNRGRRRGRGGHNRRRSNAAGAAALFGAIIGSAIEAEARRDRHARDDAHVRWCYRNYRSYREYDNSYQPFDGPRRECISPYY